MAAAEQPVSTVLRTRMRVRGGFGAQAARYTALTYVARLSLVAKAFLLASLLGPHSYGLVAAFTTFVAYAAYLDLGLFNAQNREIPLLRGGGRTAESRRVASLAFGGVVSIATIACTALAGVAALQAAGVVGGSPFFFAALAFAIGAQQLAGFRNSLCYAERQFDVQARGLALAAGLDLAVSLIAAARWGATGVLAVAAVGPLVQHLVLRRTPALRVRPRLEPRMTLRLVQIGIPIGLVWFASTNLITLDKLVVLAALGRTELGLYTLAGAAGALLMVAPNALANLFAPRVLELIGSAPNGAAAARLTEVAVLGASLAGGALAAVAIVLVPALVPHVLPAYVDGIAAAQVLVVASAVLACLTPLVTNLIGRGRQWRVVAVYAAATGFNLALDVALVALGFGITAVAVGSFVSYVALAAALHAEARSSLSHVVRSLAAVLCAPAIAFAAVRLLDVGAAGNGPVRGGLALAVVALAAAPLLAGVVRSTLRVARLGVEGSAA